MIANKKQPNINWIIFIKIFVSHHLQIYTEVTKKSPRKYMSLEEAKELPDYLLIEELRKSKSMRSRYEQLRKELLYERGHAKARIYKRKREKSKLKEGNDIND